MFSNGVCAYFHDNLHSNHSVMLSREFQKLLAKPKWQKTWDVELHVRYVRTTPRQRRWSAPSRACRRRIGSSSARSSDASSTYHQQPAQGWVQWRSPSPRSAPWGSHVQLCRLPSASCWAQMPKCLRKMRRFCELISWEHGDSISSPRQQQDTLNKCRHACANNIKQLGQGIWFFTRSKVTWVNCTKTSQCKFSRRNRVETGRTRIWIKNYKILSCKISGPSYVKPAWFTNSIVW